MNSASETSSRIASIESVRYLAAFAIVFLHFFPFDGLIKQVVDETTRFAVPFFFVVSGYFLAKKLKYNDSVRIYIDQIKKILLLYIGWQMIYFLYPEDVDFASYGFFKGYAYKFIRLFESSVEYILFDGFTFHLWFLLSLAFTVFIFMIFRTKNIKLLLLISVVLYVIGVLTRAYVNTPIGISVDINTRDYIFFSALPFFLGAWFALNDTKISIKQAYVITIIGFTLHYSEAWFLLNYFNSDIRDYGFSTFLMGIGIFQIALNEPVYLNIQTLANLGKLSLGIYCSHVLINLILVRELSYTFDSDLKKVMFPILIFILANGLVLLLKKIKYLKQLV